MVEVESADGGGGGVDWEDGRFEGVRGWFLGAVTELYEEYVHRILTELGCSD